MLQCNVLHKCDHAMVAAKRGGPTSSPLCSSQLKLDFTGIQTGCLWFLLLVFLAMSLAIASTDSLIFSGQLHSCAKKYIKLVCMV